MPLRSTGPIAVLVLLAHGVAWADAPVASYIFPAGGRRGTTVSFKVGGLNLFRQCGFEMLGNGVEAPRQLQRTRTLWLEGPLLPLPDSQQAEDYPKDMAGKLDIAADAAPGVRAWRVWTAQGATPALKFMVGDLPEIVETEIAGDPVPVAVQLPVTINGRIFPRENVDIWTFPATKGQTITAEVHAARLGSPLDSHLEAIDPHGRRLAENDDTYGADSFVCFTAPEDGTYQVRIRDIGFKGGPAYVYRLTLQVRPHIRSVFPLGGRRGDKVTLELNGEGLHERRVEVALPATSPAEYDYRVNVDGRFSNTVRLDVDDLPEQHQDESAGGQTPKVMVPAMLNGRLCKPGDASCWTMAARKGEPLDLDLRAARLGSPLCAVLTILDESDKQLAQAENSGAVDPHLFFTPPADGTYQLRITERFHNRGGPAYAYRLRVASPVADFRLILASDAVSLNRGAAFPLKLTVARLGGFAGAIKLEVDGLPAGVTATATTIAAKQAAGAIILKADASAAIQASRLTIRGTAPVGDAMITRTAALPTVRGETPLASVLLGVGLPTPFKIVGDYDMRWASRGSMHQRHYRIERNGYDGPIEVSLADRQARHLQGVTGPAITVPAGASDFSYRVFLPPWMETGRTCRVCVMGVATVKEADGTEHEVSYGSVQPNEQIVTVIEPGRLSVETAPASLTVVPGQTATVTVRIGRGKGLDGPVKLELIVAEHMHGITAEALTIPADQSSGRLSIRFADTARGPFNLPVLLRATLIDKGDPVVAETHLTLVPLR